jgi:hypothetical protein
MFVDIRSPNTIANLRENPSIEINIVDQLLRKGYRFKGTADVLTEGPAFEAVLASRRKQGLDNPMRALVMMKVERALPMKSPDYDSGAGEADVKRRWLQYWESLWAS